MRVDALAVEAIRAFRAHGVDPILLKGPAIAHWIYPEDEPRAYGDVDLLVPLDAWESCHTALAELGYADTLGAMGHPGMESHSGFPWGRGDDCVDLHCTLWGVMATPTEVWAELEPSAVPIRLAGVEVRALSPEARALHVALHAAQDGGRHPKGMADLERALAVLPESTWHTAAEIAGRLDATAAFATGLRLCEDGARITEELSLEEGSVAGVLRASAVPLAEGLEHLASTPGARAKLRLAVAELFPSAAFMRWWAPRLARGGRAGLVLAYLWRPVWIALRAAPAVLAWRRARRAAVG